MSDPRAWWLARVREWPQNGLTPFDRRRVQRLLSDRHRRILQLSREVEQLSMLLARPERQPTIHRLDGDRCLCGAWPNEAHLPLPADRRRLRAAWARHARAS